MFHREYLLDIDPLFGYQAHGIPTVLTMEWRLLILTVVVLWISRSFTRDAFQNISSAWGYAAQRPTLSIFLVSLLALVGSIAASVFIHMPTPRIHDEFSYLLAADTFAHGRLTNPTHPFWQHFETFHVIHLPTYMSKFPPGQGLILALGQRLGHPAIGLWISSALACAALTWMLRAWLPPRWALLGAVLPTLKIGILSYWAQSYWGGMLALFAGSLFFGALKRSAAKPTVITSAIMGAGMVLLAITRPFEGLLAVTPALCWLFVTLLKRGVAIKLFFSRVLMPLMIINACGLAMLGYYHYRVTGDPFKMPYKVAQEMYGIGSAFPWTAAKPLEEYRHDVMRRFDVDWVMPKYREQREHFARHVLDKSLHYWLFFIGPAFTLPLLFIPFTLKRPAFRLAAFTWLLFAVYTFLSMPFRLHYLAPIAGLIYALIMQSIRHISACLRSYPHLKQTLTRAMALTVLLTTTGMFFVFLRRPPQHWGYEREALLSKLTKSGDKHLILVRYKPNHSVHSEWVYNEADIDRAQVVWSREMDPASDRALIEYFKDRTVWLFQADETNSKLTPYPSA